LGGPFCAHGMTKTASRLSALRLWRVAWSHVTFGTNSYRLISRRRDSCRLISQQRRLSDAGAIDASTPRGLLHARCPQRPQQDGHRSRASRRSVRALVALGALLAASLAVGVGGASAGRVDPPGHQDANHCVTDSGVDLNELFAVPEQFRNAFCRELSAGEHWPFAFWVTDDGVESVYPAGYVPLDPMPLVDFVAKLTVKMVIDGGTPQEKAYVFSPDEAVRTDITADKVEPGFPPLPMAATMPRMQPLGVGEHTLELFWVLSAQHCDGLGAVVEENCLPAGELPFGVRPVTVTQPAR
jgi:hypothetical protein